MAKLGELVADVHPGGRLTLTSGSPVTTSDVTAATSVYYTPYIGNKVAIYNSSEWLFFEFSELTLSLSGYTADTNYDIFIYDSSGTPALESVAWSSATARATEVVRQDGVLVKSDDETRRYLGTIRTTSTTGQCEDSESKRYVWNYYNRTVKNLKVKEQTGHTYGTASWRIWNNDSTILVEFVIGVAEDRLEISHSARGYNSMLVGVGYDSASPITTYNYVRVDTTTIYVASSNSQNHMPSIGYHYYSLIQWGVLSGSYFTDGHLVVWMRG